MASSPYPDPPWMADETVELRLLRVLGPADDSTRSLAAQFLSAAPEYRFAIHRSADGQRVGRIHLRVTNDPKIVDALGHLGYAVDEPYRHQSYGSRAIRLILALARREGVMPISVFVEPHNVASRHTLEKCGFRLIEESVSRPEAVALGLGPTLCRYALAEF